MINLWNDADNRCEGFDNVAVKVSVSSEDESELKISSVSCITTEAEVGETFEITVYAESVSNGYLEIYNSTNDDTQVSNLEKISDGEYKATFSVVNSWKNGEYILKSIQLQDEYGNCSFTSSNDEEKCEGFDDVKINVFGIDNDPPVIKSIEALSTEVTAGNSFIITVYAEDESEINNSGTIVLYNVNDNSQQSAVLEETSDGVFKATFNVDSDWTVGEYLVSELWLTDTRDNIKKICKDDEEKCDGFDNIKVTVVEKGSNESNPIKTLLKKLISIFFHWIKKLIMRKAIPL